MYTTEAKSIIVSIVSSTEPSVYRMTDMRSLLSFRLVLVHRASDDNKAPNRVVLDVDDRFLERSFVTTSSHTSIIDGKRPSLCTK